ncbi:hypothetical protein EON63_05595, partial [archaeon]
MCGIGVVLQADAISYDVNDFLTKLNAMLSNRGPNHSQCLSIPVHNDSTAHFLASVLHIQGTDMTPQPVVDDNGNISMWNGEVFAGYDDWPTDLSDTIMLSTIINLAIQTTSDVSEALLSTLGKVKGPYAFIYYHTQTHTLYYGRDPMGRRSLCTFTYTYTKAYVPGDGALAQPNQHTDVRADDELVHIHSTLTHTHTHVLCISSVCVDIEEKRIDGGGRWEEVGIGGIYSLCIAPHTHTQPSLPQFHTWPATQVKLTRSLPSASHVSSPSPCTSPYTSPSPVYLQFLEHMMESIRRRVSRCHGARTHTHTHTPPPPSSLHPSPYPSSAVGVLFSGGVDSLLLAALLHLVLKEAEGRGMGIGMSVDGGGGVGCMGMSEVGRDGGVGGGS